MRQYNTREMILKILLSVLRDGEKSHEAIRRMLDEHPYLTKQEKAFVKTVAEGTIERSIELDYIIDRFAMVKTTEMKPAILQILRSAVYQMLYVNSVPSSAACNEAVKLTQKMGYYNLKAFVNGVLRTIDRNRESIDYPSGNNRMEYLSVRYSMPRWIVKMWTDEFGEDITTIILEDLLRPRKLTVRLRMDPDRQKKALAMLAQQGVTAKRLPLFPYAYELSGTGSVAQLTAFRNGLIYPQDPGSMMIVEAAAPERGDEVFDLCAAPGGKSLHLADKMAGFGMVEARDLTEEKVALIRENIQRTDQINIHVARQDATLFDAASEGKADIVLCDVPCSGLGVIGRKPDIKYRASLSAIEELVLLQRTILHNAAAYVRPGGVLIYSTCTINHMENYDNARWFSENYPFEFESLDPYLPRELHSVTTAKGYLQTIPGVHPMDGFFVARFRKVRQL